MNTEDFEEEMERMNEEWKKYARAFQREHADQYAYLNERMKELFFENVDVDLFARFVVHYCFRNGPVEDMHARGKLSQEDMKTLNKYMVNSVAELFELAMSGEWLKFYLLYAYNSINGKNWDKAEPDMEISDIILGGYLSDIADDSDNLL